MDKSATSSCHKIITLIGAIFSAATISGCTPKTGLVLEASDILAMNTQNQNETYVLGIGDTIAVKFFYNEKLNDEVIIRPDGKISLQLIGDLKAAGLTPAQLESRLTSKYFEVLKSSKEKESYVLGIGDTIAVKFFYNEKLNDEVTIRPDGKISLQLIGDLRAAGLTPAQLESQLTSKYFEVLRASKEKESYVLGVGDTIAVKFFYNDKLNDEVTIRPDGKISLQLIGDLRAAGLTPAQLESQLTSKYSKVLESLEVTVIVRDIKMPVVTVIVRDVTIPAVTVAVREFTSQKIYVGGEVSRPRLIPLRGMLRILDAVIQAGGALNTAKLENVILIRYNGTEKPDAYSLDLNRIICGEISDVILRPYDIIYLPKTTIAKVDLFMQHIYRVLPIDKALFSFPYNLNPQVEVVD